MSARDLYAWVTLMPSGRWNLVGMLDPGTGHIPLVSHDLASLEGAREIALAHGKALGQRVELVRWHGIETLEGFDP